MALFGHHLLAAGGVEHGAAPLEQAVHAAGRQLAEVVVDQAAVAVVNAQHLDAVGAGRAHHGADYSVHARGVAAGRENSDSANLFFFHKGYLLYRIGPGKPARLGFALHTLTLYSHFIHLSR